MQKQRNLSIQTFVPGNLFLFTRRAVRLIIEALGISAVRSLTPIHKTVILLVVRSIVESPRLSTVRRLRFRTSDSHFLPCASHIRRNRRSILSNLVKPEKCCPDTPDPMLR